MPISIKNKPFLIALLILNVIVLLGQLWPAGAPPFAHVVNVVTLVLNLIFLAMMLNQRRM